MKNRDAVERFDQAYGAKIEKLYWIAGSLKDRDFKDFINEMEEKDFEECFPEIFKSEYYQEYQNDDELVQALFDFNKFGLLAYVLIPECKNFTFKEGSERPTSWSSSAGVCRVAYCYGETREELLKSIEKKAEEIFQEYIQKHKSKVVGS